jgi:hypothetical protein
MEEKKRERETKTTDSGYPSYTVPSPSMSWGVSILASVPAVRSICTAENDFLEFTRKRQIAALT